MPEFMNIWSKQIDKHNGYSYQAIYVINTLTLSAFMMLIILQA